MYMYKIMHAVYSKNLFILPKLPILQRFHVYHILGLVDNNLKVSIQSL